MSSWSKLLSVIRPNGARKESTIGPSMSNSELFRQQPPLYKSGVDQEIQREPGLEIPLIDPIDLATTVTSSMIGLSKIDNTKKVLQQQIQSLKGQVNPVTEKYLTKALTASNKDEMRNIIRGLKTDINNIPNDILYSSNSEFNPGNVIRSSIHKDQTVKGEIGQGLRNYFDSDNFLNNNKFMNEYYNTDKVLGNQTIMSRAAAESGDLRPLRILERYKAEGAHIPRSLMRNNEHLPNNVSSYLKSDRIDPSKSLIIIDEHQYPLDMQSLLHHEQSHINQKGLPTILERIFLEDPEKVALLKNFIPKDIDISSNTNSKKIIELLANEGLTVSDLSRLNSAYHHSTDKIITPEYENLLKYLTKSTRKNSTNKLSNDIFNELSKIIPGLSVENKYEE